MNNPNNRNELNRRKQRERRTAGLTFSLLSKPSVSSCYQEGHILIVADGSGFQHPAARSHVDAPALPHRAGNPRF